MIQGGALVTTAAGSGNGCIRLECCGCCCCCCCNESSEDREAEGDVGGAMS